METQRSQLRLTVADLSALYLPRNDVTRFLLRSENGEVIVGRAVDADIRIQSDMISRKHAAIDHDGQHWRIRDLGSKAGTQVNQSLVPATEYRILECGDQIQLGPIALGVTVPREVDAAASSLLLGDGMPERTCITARELGGFVSTIPDSELSGLAQHRLSVLLQSAASITAAPDATTLAAEITQAAARGTSSPRVILIGISEDKAWTVLGQYPVENRRAIEIEISRSLVMLASRGRVAQLHDGGDDSIEAQSIERLHIQSAIGAPIFIDERVVAVLYLDARENEKPITDDAAAFCVGLAQLGGMALANLNRAELARQEKELRDELVAARLAQQRMIPASSGVAGPVAYALESIPGTIVAGDLFDIMSLDENCALVLLGDVMGKGAAAGLMMATVQTYFRARVHSRIDVSLLSSEANAYFFDRFQGDGFVTLWIGIFHKMSRRLCYVDAGHGHWGILGPGSELRSIESEGGPPLGALPDSKYSSGDVSLEPGERIILFSDGLAEQQNEAGQIFGEPSALDCLSASGSAEEDVRLLVESHRSFRGEIPPSDDLTIASIEFIDPGSF